MDYWTSEDKRRVPLGPIWTEDLLVLLDEPNDPDQGEGQTVWHRPSGSLASHSSKINGGVAGEPLVI